MATKRIRLNSIEYEQKDIFCDKISMEKMKEIWNDNQVTYTEDELIKIRDWLYAITGAIFDTVKSCKSNIIEFKPKDNDETEGNFVCESEYGRAS